jgi:hypothetical protein
MDVLTSDASAARRALGDTVVVERASFEEIVVLLDAALLDAALPDEEVHHA